MNNKYLSVDAVSYGQEAEQLREKLVSLDIVLVLDFTFETVHLIQISWFMIAPSHEEMARIQGLPGQQANDDFDGEGTSVNEISIEQIGVSLRGVAIDLEDIHQIVVLSVNITTDSDFLVLRHGDVHQAFIFFENFTTPQNNHICVFLVELFALTHSAHHFNDPVAG